MWSHPIDNLYNPEYEKVTDYRKLLRHMNVYIAVDVATRTEDNDGEVHLCLLERSGLTGFLTVHDRYESGLAPMFCMPNIKAVNKFRARIEEAILWFDKKEDLWTWFADNNHLKHPVYKKNPLVMGLFVRDVVDHFKEKENLSC